MTHFLEITGINKQYGPVVAVQDVELTMPQGEFMTFLGPSGSGKSTTLYILAGFEQPTRGDILLNGKTILDTPSHKRNIGMVFQRYTLFPHLSVGENIAFPLKVRGWSKAEITERVRKMLSLVRLEGFEDRKPAAMSGGQQQRVALARALAYDPPVLLMDEPLSALDKKLREEIQHEIRRIHQQTEVTILYVTHDQEEALRLSDRISVFNQGRIEQIGTGQQLYDAPATRFVAEFIGDSNFIDVDVVSVNGQFASLSLPNGGMIDGVPVHGNVAVAGKASLLLRPERIDMRIGTGGGLVDGNVGDMTFLGNNIHLIVERKNAGPVSVRLPYGHSVLEGLAPGAPVSLHFRASETHAFAKA